MDSDVFVYELVPHLHIANHSEDLVNYFDDYYTRDVLPENGIYFILRKFWIL